jgi:glycogen debranching enzyme
MTSDESVYSCAVGDKMQLTISRDTTSLISDGSGDIPDGAEFGLYLDDTRILQRHELALDGRPAIALGARATDHCSATHFLTNPALPRVPRGVLSIVRRRYVERGLREELEITNYWTEAAELSLQLCYRGDFAHVIAVRQRLKRSSELSHSTGIAPCIAPDRHSLQFDGDGSDPFRITLCKPPDLIDDRCEYGLRLAPRERWHLCIQYRAGRMEDSPADGTSIVCLRNSELAPQGRWELRLADLVDRAPHLETDSHVLRQAYTRSVHDLASLRTSGEASSNGDIVIAAGMPWFKALFGRDALITAYQALPFYPDLARGVLKALARLQGNHVDPVSQEEPGKIIHEDRPTVPDGAQALIPRFPYYGTVDATPLFLMLLASVHGATGDLEFSASLRDNALRALAWLDQHGDLDGDGYVEYVRDDTGLVNHGWKDSFDAVQFRDGTHARPPIALCEVQGYAYAARVGMAKVFADLGDRKLAARLDDDASALKERFNRDFWMADREYYALALDADKRPVDAITSNPGHLLWSGLADRDKAELVAKRLLSPDLFSGWGIRTMAATEVGYNPISYHNGSVWPHDTVLILAGLARYGFIDEATKLADGLLATLDHDPDRRLPEVFAGYSRDEAPFPVDHPMASRPQAWAAGSVLLLLSTIAGLDPSVPDNPAPPLLPSGVNRVHIDGIWVGPQETRVEVVRSKDGVVTRRR